MSEQMRKEFEAWASRYHGTARMGVIGLIYSNEAVQHDWNVWQASRQALIVELPRVTGDAVYDAQEVLDALDRAGVSYQ